MSPPKHRPEPLDPSRRRLLAGLAGTAGAALLPGCGNGGDQGSAASGALPLPTDLPAPQDSGIDHIVVLMMENRSFDHYLGWLPGADGVQAGRSFPDKQGQAQTSHDLAPDFANCADADPDHSYDGGRKQFNGGRMDGFLQTAPDGDTFPIGYYTRDSLPFLGAAAQAWTVCDRYFCGILSSTYPNRFYMHSGQTDRLSNTMDISSLPTIWDRLAAKGRSGKYYFNDLPILALWGDKHLGISRPFAEFLLDATLGTLPDVSYIDPRFLGEGQGISNDDHPLADIRAGQAFLNQVYDALRNGPAWEKTLFVINYDEWGGFADHVPPALAPVSDDERTVVGNDGRLGFRVPLLLIGPRAKRGHVEHIDFDPSSILNLIAWRFGLDGIGVRAPTSNNMVLALDFANPPNTEAPAFAVPSAPLDAGCLTESLPLGKSLHDLDPATRSRTEHLLELQALKALAQRYGFAVG